MTEKRENQISLIGKGNSEMNLVRFREKHTPMSVSVHTNLLLALPVEVPNSVPGLVPVPVPVALLVPDEMVREMEVKSMEMEEDFAEEYDSNDVDEEKIEDGKKGESNLTVTIVFTFENFVVLKAMVMLPTKSSKKW